MKQTSKARIKRILDKHCVMVTGELSRPVKDQFGDVLSFEKYGEQKIYISQLLHRYNPYIELKTDDDNTGYRRRTPMAIIPYDSPLDIHQGDILSVSGKDYNIVFCEDVKGYYYLLSLSIRE